PPAFVPILSKALSKNPAQRYLSISEFAKAVASADRGARSGESSSGDRPALIRRPSQERPSDGPALRTPRSALGELCGSMVLAAVFAFLATALWAAVVQTQTVGDLAAIFFLTVASSWAVLVPTKFWEQPLEDSIKRRVVLLLLGVIVGVLGLWVDGWTLEGGVRGGETAGTVPMLARNVPVEPGLTEAASYLSYFAVVFV